MRDPDYSPELAGRLSKLESAISKQRTIKFGYWRPRRRCRARAVAQPLCAPARRGNWYVVGHDLDRDDIRTFRVSRIRGDIRFATRRERDFRLPADFDVEHTGSRGRGRSASRRHRADRGLRRHGLVGGAHAQRGRHGRATGSSRRSTPTSSSLAGWVLRQNGRAVPLEPDELRAACAEGLRRVREAHEAEPPKLARAKAVARVDAAERPAPPVAPERFGVLQALLAHLLAACGDGTLTPLDAAELADRFSIPLEELQEHLSLLNLVNFGGGCYTVYAEHEGDIVRVDKELYGDVFRLAPQLTPLEARAIRLAIEYVGPTIAAEAHTPLDRVRKKLEETFGQFERAPAPGDARRPRRGGARRDALRRRSSSGASSRSST